VMPVAPSTLRLAGDSAFLTNGAAATSIEGALNAELLFRALDGRWLTVSGDRWRAEVYGVTQEGGWRWVQVGLHGARDHMITIRTVPTSGTSQVILALTAWLAGSEPGPDVVSIC
jgi:hypothetical protein